MLLVIKPPGVPPARPQSAFGTRKKLRPKLTRSKTQGSKTRPKSAVPKKAKSLGSAITGDLSNKKKKKKKKTKKKKSVRGIAWKKKKKKIKKKNKAARAQQRADFRRYRRAFLKDKKFTGDGTLYIDQKLPWPIPKLKAATYGDNHYFHPQSRLCPESPKKQSSPEPKPKKFVRPEAANYFVSPSHMCPEAEADRVKREIAEKRAELSRTKTMTEPLLRAGLISEQQFDYDVNQVRAKLQMALRQSQECKQTDPHTLTDKMLDTLGIGRWSASKKRPDLDRPPPKYKFKLQTRDGLFVASKVRCKAGLELKPSKVPDYGPQIEKRFAVAKHAVLVTLYNDGTVDITSPLTNELFFDKAPLLSPKWYAEDPGACTPRSKRSRMSLPSRIHLNDGQRRISEALDYMCEYKARARQGIELLQMPSLIERQQQHALLYTCSICTKASKPGTTFFNCECIDKDCGVCLQCLPRRAHQEAKRQRDYLTKLSRPTYGPPAEPPPKQNKIKRFRCSAGGFIRPYPAEEIEEYVLQEMNMRKAGGDVKSTSPKSQHSEGSRSIAPILTNVCRICKEDVKPGEMLYDCDCEVHRILGREIKIGTNRQVCRKCLPDRVKRERAEMSANAHRLMTRLCEPENYQDLITAWF